MEQKEIIISLEESGKMRKIQERLDAVQTQMEMLNGIAASIVHEKREWWMKAKQDYQLDPEHRHYSVDFEKNIISDNGPKEQPNLFVPPGLRIPRKGN